VMDNLEADDLVEQVQVSRLDNKWLLAFLKKGKVYLQQIQGSEHVGEREEFELKANPDARVDEEAEVAAWYDQNFIAWGTRKIENRKSDDAPREAFYIRKLSYQKEKTGMIQGAK
jgi:hypothetical protein